MMNNSTNTLLGKRWIVCIILCICILTLGSCTKKKTQNSSDAGSSSSAAADTDQSDQSRKEQIQPEYRYYDPLDGKSDSDRVHQMMETWTLEAFKNAEISESSRSGNYQITFLAKTSDDRMQAYHCFSTKKADISALVFQDGENEFHVFPSVWKGKQISGMTWMSTGEDTGTKLLLEIGNHTIENRHNTIIHNDIFIMEKVNHTEWKLHRISQENYMKIVTLMVQAHYKGKKLKYHLSKQKKVAGTYKRYIYRAKEGDTLYAGDVVSCSIKGESVKTQEQMKEELENVYGDAKGSKNSEPKASSGSEQGGTAGINAVPENSSLPGGTNVLVVKVPVYRMRRNKIKDQDIQDKYQEGTVQFEVHFTGQGGIVMRNAEFVDK